MAKDNVPPANSLGWTATAPAAELALTHLIVFKGPGSWKREARWDEYVVAIGNPGSDSLVIESAELVDVLGQPQFPGTDPWELEKLSRTNWDKYGKSGLKLLAGAGVVAIYVGAASAAAMGSFLAGAGATGGSVAALNVIPVLAVVNITAVAVMNSKNKKKVVAEFDRRRCVLPLTIEPGAAVSGSFFFPMTPAPKQLRVTGKRAGEPVELVLDLKQLADLHMKPAQK